MNTPKVTVLLPIYNSFRHLRESLDSICAQTYKNWDLLAIHEFGSTDGSAEIVKEYEKKDRRIHLIQNQEKLGLADSLNKGMQLADGIYIARMDADDLSHAARFEKQIAFLDKNPKIGLCGTYQHHFGPHMNWVHKTPITPESCRANLMFDCDICHSTVMFRKELFFQQNLFYDKNFLAEDFELWSRAVGVMDFGNIPEVLGEYRWDGENISITKKKLLAKENAIIVANALKRNLKFCVPKEDYILLEGWGNPFTEERDRKRRSQMYQRFQELLIEIYKANKVHPFYEEKALLNIIAAKWRHMRYLEPRNERRNVHSLEEIFDPHYRPDYRMMWRAYRERSTSILEDAKKAFAYIKKR